LLVESGGRTAEGTDKLHVWWQLSEPAEGADSRMPCPVARRHRRQGRGDTHSGQPINRSVFAGTVYHKGGLRGW